jgi:hypothetical protein
VDAYQAAQAGGAASSIPAGYAVASDGVTLINPTTGAYQVGTAEGGGALMSDGTTVASGAKGGGFGSPSTAGYIGAAVEGVQALNSLRGDRGHRETAQDFAKHAGLAAANIYTMGLASVADNLLMRTKFGRKLDSGLRKIDKSLGYFGPTGALGGLFELGGIGGKSSKVYQAQRWGDLGTFNKPEEGDEVDPYLERNQMAYMANHPENDDGIWDEGPHKGQKWSWDLVKEDIKKDGSQGNLFLGNIETFGNEWHDIDVNKRNEIVKRLATEDLYTSEKGDVYIHSKNQDRARQIKNEVLGIKPEDEKEKDNPARGEGPAPIEDPIV